MEPFLCISKMVPQDRQKANPSILGTCKIEFPARELGLEEIEEAIKNDNTLKLIVKNGFGTGFLLGSDYLLTNNHVLPNENRAEKASFIFKYERKISNNTIASSCVWETPFTIATFDTSCNVNLFDIKFEDGQESELDKAVADLDNEHLNSFIRSNFEKKGASCYGFGLGKKETQAITVIRKSYEWEIQTTFKKYLVKKELGCNGQFFLRVYGRFFYTDKRLDYTLLKIKGLDNTHDGRFYNIGSLKLSTTEPKTYHNEIELNQKVSGGGSGNKIDQTFASPLRMIHHPGGYNKRFGEGFGFTMGVGMYRVEAKNRILKNRICHSIITYDGSSGAPIMNEEFEVVGIHNTGSVVITEGNVAVFNMGTKIESVLVDLAKYKEVPKKIMTLCCGQAWNYYKDMLYG